MAQPPQIPASVGALIKDTPLLVKQRRDKVANQLDTSNRELYAARKRVDELVARVKTEEDELAQLDERLSSFTDQERIEALEAEVTRLNGELQHHTHVMHYGSYVRDGVLYSNATVPAFYRP